MVVSLGWRAPLAVWTAQGAQISRLITSINGPYTSITGVISPYLLQIITNSTAINDRLKAHLGPVVFFTQFCVFAITLLSWGFSYLQFSVVSCIFFNCQLEIWYNNLKIGEGYLFQKGRTKNAQSSSSYIPIGSVGLVYWPIFTIRNQPNVGNYTVNINIGKLFLWDIYLPTNQSCTVRSHFNGVPLQGYREMFR